MSTQKRKLLYILKYLSEQTDENHPCKVSDIQKMLKENDIEAARKSIYDDVRSIEESGYDIVGVGGKYMYMGSREFELAELKLLVDSVQYSKFITNKKTRELIAKLSALCSVHDAKKLKRDVLFRDSIKSINETVYYNVDTLTNAIMEDSQITFKYFEYTISGKQYRKGGKLYTASPFSLIIDNENYYLLAYDEDSAQLRHYRVDKMEKITILSKCRNGKQEFEKIDMSRYSSRVFGMFKGEETDVRMRFTNSLANAVLDILGNDLILAPSGDSHFVTTAKVQVSPHFFGWIFALGDGAEILGPEDVRRQMKEYLESTSKLYEG